MAPVLAWPRQFRLGLFVSISALSAIGPVSGKSKRCPSRPAGLGVESVGMKKRRHKFSLSLVAPAGLIYLPPREPAILGEVLLKVLQK
jgi:hypothetical protein